MKYRVGVDFISKQTVTIEVEREEIKRPAYWDIELTDEEVAEAKEKVYNSFFDVDEAEVEISWIRESK